MTTDADVEASRARKGREWFEYVMGVPTGSGAPSPFSAIAGNNFVFGDVWSRPGLDIRSRRFVTIACLGFVGAELPLKMHVYAALKSGDISYEELQEAILQFSGYAGCPKATVMELAAREAWARVQAEGGPVKRAPPAA